LAFIVSSSFAQSSSQQFEKANQYYQKNELDKAIQGYETLLKEGHESAALYYNLGNAYYKLNNNSLAILNYEKARKLSPQDEDIQFNLRMANLKVTDKVEPVPVLFYENWWNHLLHWFAFDQWAKIGIVLLWLVFALVLWFILSATRFIKQLTFYLSVFLFLMAALAFYCADTAFLEYESHNEAIIFVPSVYVKSSPTEKSTDLFILHEGSKVQILDKLGPWKKIRLLNGNVGWLKEGAVALI
jgi:tetratricopeptide (TPR) repeat protein